MDGIVAAFAEPTPWATSPWTTDLEKDGIHNRNRPILTIMGKGDTLINAVLGAVVTVIFSFIGFSPVIGGAVSGYLQQESRRSCVKVGALSGVFAFLPFMFFIFLIVGIVTFLMPMGGSGLPGGLELLIIFLVIVPFVAIWNIGLGALGGFFGSYLREEFGQAR